MGLDRNRNLSVPDGYFEELPTVISEQIASESAMQRAQVGWWKRYRIGWATGFAVMGAIVVIFFYNQKTVEDLPQLAASDVYEYVSEEYLAYYTEDELVEEYLAILEETDDGYETELTPIEEELLEEDIDIELLIDEL